MRKIGNFKLAGFALLLSACLVTSATAKVSSEEAAKLGKELTPFGAEKAGNADGTIPAWDGGITEPPAGLNYQGTGTRHPDPYASDKVLFSVTAQNMVKYADNLSPGQKALLQKYPDSFRLDIYPTRRPQAAPKWVYKNTADNAVSGTLTEDGNGVQNAFGGIPFPIPQSGAEAMWNHLLRWQGSGSTLNYRAYLVQTDGAIAAGGGGRATEKLPFYEEGGSLATYNGNTWLFFLQYDMPARRKGEVLLINDPLNQTESPRKAWQYLVGQRRVRRAPTVAYDTPNSAFSGAVTYDDAFVFNGSPDRYDWKLVGKQEMFIPYNCTKADEKVDPKAIYTGKHLNPDYVRMELHRVWVVEGTVKEGKRHAYAKRTFFLDEDSWVAVASDSYDARGNLWRTNLGLVKHAYELPAVVQRLQVHYDLTTGKYAVNNAQTEMNGITKYGNPKKDKFFTPEQIRRSGRR
jgi:hypothetical protein